MPCARSLCVDLSSYLNNAGIAPAGRPSGGGLDGMGTSFRAEDLPPPAGVATCLGVPFLLPGRSRRGMDNIACEGQEIPLPAGACEALHLLGMCDWRAFEEPLRLRAPDGTGVETSLGLSDAPRYQGLQYGEDEAVSCPLITPDSLVPHVFLFGVAPPGAGYEMTETRIEAGIWRQVVPVEEPRPLAAMVLPDNPSMHLFAVTMIAGAETP